MLVSYLSYASKMGPKRFPAKILFTVLFIINLCRICVKLESVFSYMSDLFDLVHEDKRFIMIYRNVEKIVYRSFNFGSKTTKRDSEKPKIMRPSENYEF